MEADMRGRSIRVEVVHHELAGLTSPLVLLTAFITCVALLLSGALGYLLGKQAGRDAGAREQPQTRQQLAVSECQRLGSAAQDPAEHVLQPRLGSTETLKHTVDRRHLQDLDSARQLTVGPLGKDAPRPEARASMGLIAESAEEPHPAVPLKVDALQAVYANYISQWQDTAVPWGERPQGRVSNMASRIASYASEASELMWQSSMNVEAGAVPVDAGHELDKSLSFGSDLRASDWHIDRAQLQYCLTPTGKQLEVGEPDPGSRVKHYKALLDGKTDVVVKAITVAKGAIPEEKVRDFARQQMALNGVSQLLHFFGVCREGAGADRETLLLVYEHVTGGNMRAAAKRSPDELAWYRFGKVVARDVAQALAHLHRRGLEHRSLKSQRVMVRASDRAAKLADAGLQTLARLAGDSRCCRVTNVVDWAAPELLLGQQCGPKADIYSYGVLLWELVTQEVPIRGAQRSPQVPQECPAAIRGLIERCMAGEPDARPSAEEVVQVIQRAWNVGPDGSVPCAAAFPAPGPPLAATPLSAFAHAAEPALQPRPGGGRGVCDSVTEMVDIRRGLPVRRGTIQSVQSAGGARSPCSTPRRHLAGKPPTSPHSSPNARRVRLQSLAASQQQLSSAAPPMARAGLHTVGESDLAARLQHEQLERERRRRARGLEGIRSDPGALASRRPASERPASERPASERPASEQPASERPASERPAPPRGQAQPQRAPQAAAQPAARLQGAASATPPASSVQAEAKEPQPVTAAPARAGSVLLGSGVQEAMRREAAAALAGAKEEQAAAKPEHKVAGTVQGVRPASHQSASSSRSSRWRQKCDLSLHNWIRQEGQPAEAPADAPAGGADAAKKGGPLTGRRGSLPRLPGFLRPSGGAATST